MKIEIKGDFDGKSFGGNIHVQDTSRHETKDFIIHGMPLLVGAVFEQFIEDMKDAPLPKSEKVAMFALMAGQVVKNTLSAVNEDIDDFLGEERKKDEEDDEDEDDMEDLCDKCKEEVKRVRGRKSK